MFWSKKTSLGSVPDGHLVWVKDGKVIDMGAASLEDLKLTAYVTQEAKNRLTPKRNTASALTLSRVAAMTKRMYDAALTKS